MIRQVFIQVSTQMLKHMQSKLQESVIRLPMRFRGLSYLVEPGNSGIMLSTRQ